METQEIKIIYKWVWIVLIVLAVFLGVQTLLSLRDLREISPAYNSITITGEGEAFAVPDIATFSFGVSADASTVSQAQEEVTKKIDAIVEALGELEIDEKDIKTTDYSVYPKYVYSQQPCSVNFCPPSNQKQDGYTANHSITVKVRNTDNAGQALTIAGENNVTNLSGISFTVDDEDKVTEEARSLAIKDAREKAETLSRELGVKLVRVVSFSDNMDGGIMPYYRTEEADMMGSAVSQPKAPTLPMGENRTRIVVSVTYEIR